MRPFTIGTHNLHDEAGVPTRFADLVLFTEAIPHTIEQVARPDAAPPLTPVDQLRRSTAIAATRLAGYGVVVVHPQPDLVLMYRRRLFKRRGPCHYHRVVDGVPHVTPNRGTAWQLLEHRGTGILVAAVWEHRINAAFEPFVRGEPQFRRLSWQQHTDHTNDLIARLRDSGYLVLSGGDVNTPRGVDGYMLGSERGEGFDRLALAAPKPREWRLSAPEYLSRKGSDHPRLRATVTGR